MAKGKKDLTNKTGINQVENKTDDLSTDAARAKRNKDTNRKDDDDSITDFE